MDECGCHQVEQDGSTGEVGTGGALGRITEWNSKEDGVISSVMTDSSKKVKKAVELMDGIDLWMAEKGQD